MSFDTSSYICTFSPFGFCIPFHTIILHLLSLLTCLLLMYILLFSLTFSVRPLLPCNWTTMETSACFLAAYLVSSFSVSPGPTVQYSRNQLNHVSCLSNSNDMCVSCMFCNLIIVSLICVYLDCFNLSDYTCTCIIARRNKHYQIKSNQTIS